MKIFDISMSIQYDMPVYKKKNSKRPVISQDSDFTTGAAYETRLEMNMHTGTHIDRPLHMLPDGGTIDTLDLERVVTRCRVLDFKDAEEKISREHLKSKGIAEGEFILLKTKNSYYDILEGEFVYLDKTGAEYLKDRKINGVGIDALGIERNQPQHQTHKILLAADIVIIEGLRLKEIEEGEYMLAAAPVNVIGAEASPVRAMLIK